MFSSVAGDALKTFWMAELENTASYFPSNINCNNDPLSGREKKKQQESILSFKTYNTYSNENIYHSPSKECIFIYIAGKVQLHWNSRAALAGVTSFKIICIEVTVKHKWPDECKTKTCSEISGKINRWPFNILQL